MYIQRDKLRNGRGSRHDARVCMSVWSNIKEQRSIATCVNDARELLSAHACVHIPQRHKRLCILPCISPCTPPMGYELLPTQLPPFWIWSCVLKDAMTSWARQQRTDVMKRTLNRGPAILQKKANNDWCDMFWFYDFFTWYGFLSLDMFFFYFVSILPQVQNNEV